MPRRGDASCIRHCNLRQSKIEQFGLPAVRDENVLGFDVPMNDAREMGRIECVGNLQRRFQREFQVKGLAGDAFAKRLTFQHLHGDEGAARVFANLINGADIRMIQRRSGARFALKALQRLRIFSEHIGQEFQCDPPAKAKVFGSIHLAHSSSPESAQNAIVRDRFADHA